MVSQVRSQLRIEGRPKFDTCTKSLYGRVPREAFGNIIFVHWPALSFNYLWLAYLARMSLTISRV